MVRSANILTGFVAVLSLNLNVISDVFIHYLINAVVQRNRSHVFDVFSVFNASQFYQQVMPLPVIDPNFGEAK